MPNWCANVICISGEATDMLKFYHEYCLPIEIDLNSLNTSYQCQLPPEILCIISDFITHYNDYQIFRSLSRTLYNMTINRRSYLENDFYKHLFLPSNSNSLSTIDLPDFNIETKRKYCLFRFDTAWRPDLSMIWNVQKNLMMMSLRAEMAFTEQNSDFYGVVDANGNKIIWKYSNDDFEYIYDFESKTVHLDYMEEIESLHTLIPIMTLDKLDKRFHFDHYGR